MSIYPSTSGAMWRGLTRILTPFKIIALGQRSCSVLKRDTEGCYATISLGLLYSFFDWFPSQKVGKDGRKKRGIKKSSFLGTCWKVLRDLAKKHGLSEQRRANRCMTIDDLKQQIETTLSTIKKSFKLGELRILAVLFLLLLAPAGSRRKRL
ncbi:C2H2 finger domain protein [Colletotrichum tofieldiae]|uniref:C2H2 finger domain protein n=1 Tax=Colletotrichum tofieldiae TaxID=708197 RepID=A0A166V8P3_9PEZI|nr:C2H2 finger domain protein [Colletotrichum tofieldiae]